MTTSAQTTFTEDSTGVRWTREIDLKTGIVTERRVTPLPGKSLSPSGVLIVPLPHKVTLKAGNRRTPPCQRRNLLPLREALAGKLAGAFSYSPIMGRRLRRSPWRRSVRQVLIVDFKTLRRLSASTNTSSCG